MNHINPESGRQHVLTDEMESNLLGLLRSMDFENQMLALNLLEGVQAPKSTLTDLLALGMFSRHHYLRQQAILQFKRNAPRGFVLALEDELNFRKFTPNRHIEWFMRVRRRHFIDSPVLAQYMYHWEMLTLPAYMKYGIDESHAFFAPFLKGDALDLSFRGMDEVPTELEALTHLRSVDLSGNVLTQLGRIVARLPHLEKLKANGNQLTRLNPTISKMGQLKSLDLSFNTLFYLPASMAKLQSLVELNISHNDLEELSNSLTEMRPLESLDASYNALLRLPNRMHRWKNLRFLSLYGNPGLRELPDSFGGMEKLATLRLGRTGIKELPSLAGLDQLEELDLAGLNLLSLDPLKALPNLSRLNLESTTVTHLPHQLGNTPPLTLQLGGQSYSNILELIEGVQGWNLEVIQVKSAFEPDQISTLTEKAGQHRLEVITI